MYRVAALVAVLALGTTAACGSGGSGGGGPSGGAQHSGHGAGGRGSHQVAAATPTTYGDWYTYHGDDYRTGQAPTMSAVSGSPRVLKKLTLDGAVYGSPIIIGGVTIVATENDSVYAFSSSYKKLWKRHLGSPSPAAERACGNIDPLGITGTPVYAAKTGLIYVAAELSGTPPTHQLYGISAKTGGVSFHHTLDLPVVDSAAMQERGALIANGTRVYVPFGGLAGDCGAYKGRVIGYLLDGTGAPVSYTVPTSREAGIWTPPGPAIDRAGHVLVSVGNGASRVGDSYDHSDSILELSSTTLKLTDSFSPTTWATDNEQDLDLGSQGPTLVDGWVFAAGKSGTAYVLSRTHLGGIGGQVSQRPVCKSFGGTSVMHNIVYVPCTDGLRAVQISSTGAMAVLWHAATATNGSPVIGGGRIWTLDTSAGVLHALDPATGSSRGSVSVGSVTRFATPALYGRNVYVPTTTGVTVVVTS